VLSALYGHHVDVLHLEDRILVVAGKDAGHHPDLEREQRALPALPPRGLG
jgi:hypothetical protein